MAESPDDTQTTSKKDIGVRLKFEYFKRWQMGRGFVSYRQSEEEKKAGVYNPHVMFAHQDAERDDDESMKRVEDDCKDLVTLLNRFYIEPTALSAAARKCAINDVATPQSERYDPQVNRCSATLIYTHGEIEVAGTVIFVLARIAEATTSDGWVRTVKHQSLIDAEELAAQRRAQKESAGE